MSNTLRYFRSYASVLTIVAMHGISAANAQLAPVNSADAVMVGHSLTNYELGQMILELSVSKGMHLGLGVQSVPGAPLKANWSYCRAAWWVGEYPPPLFACDAIDAGTANGPLNVLIATDASNSIESNRIYNEPDVYFERFMELMLSHNPAARNFLFTSWEELGYAGHDEDWTIEVISELAQYELIAANAEELSRQRGRNGMVQVLPVNLALRRLILAIEAGSVPGMTNRSEIFADRIHPNPTGLYFVACVVYSAIFNQSPEGAATLLRDPYGNPTVNLSNALALQLQRIAWQTVSDYFGNVAETARPAPPSSLTVQ